MRTFAQKPKGTQQTMSAKSPKPDRAHFGRSREVNSILHLQHTIGNQAVQRLLQTNAEELEVSVASTASPRFTHDFSRIPIYAKTPGRLQTKLTVNAPGDIHEQEADRVADQVMRMPEPDLQHACPCGGNCPKCKKEQGAHEPVQTTPVQEHNVGEATVPSVVKGALSSPGRPLDSTTREFMESRFGHDFGEVRAHTGPIADTAAEAINARAFTVGTDIIFGAGKYAPASGEGRRLLAHELSHVVQQNQGVSPATIQCACEDPGFSEGTRVGRFVRRRRADCGLSYLGQRVRDRARALGTMMARHLDEEGYPLAATGVRAFIYAASTEGSISAVNTYDGFKLTLGVGFAGDRLVNWVRRLSLAARAALKGSLGSNGRFLDTDPTGLPDSLLVDHVRLGRLVSLCEGQYFEEVFMAQCAEYLIGSAGLPSHISPGQRSSVSAPLLELAAHLQHGFHSFQINPRDINAAVALVQTPTEIAALLVKRFMNRALSSEGMSRARGSGRLLVRRTTGAQSFKAKLEHQFELYAARAASIGEPVEVTSRVLAILPALGAGGTRFQAAELGTIPNDRDVLQWRDRDRPTRFYYDFGPTNRLPIRANVDTSVADPDVPTGTPTANPAPTVDAIEITELLRQAARPEPNYTEGALSP